jgi:hypothetical protein
MSEVYITCLNCKAECEKKAKYCWNCGFKPKKKKLRKFEEPSMSLGSSKFVELDKKKKELVIINYKVIGQPEVLRWLPLHQIDGVRLHYANRVPLMTKKLDKDNVLSTINTALNPKFDPLSSFQSKHIRIKAYNLDVKLKNRWDNYGHEENIMDALRLAAAIGLNIEERQVKLQEFADNLPNLS